MQIKVGDKIYGYHSNNNRNGDNGLPLFWQAYTITNVGRKYYEANHHIKIDKITMKQAKTEYGKITFVATLEEVEKVEFIKKQRNELSRRIEQCKDYDTLKTIKVFLGTLEVV